MNEKEEGKTWFFDLDGTLVRHNGFKDQIGEQLLPGVTEFMQQYVRDKDCVILTTGRTAEQAEMAKEILRQNNIRFDLCITNLPYGSRTVVNDIKPSGMLTAFSINVVRDEGLKKHLNQQF